MSVAVATLRGRYYYRFAQMLRFLRMRFDSILPCDIAGYEGVTFTTNLEFSGPAVGHVVFEEVLDLHPAVTAGILARVRSRAADEPRLVLGIDPGKRIGFSASYYGRDIDGAFFSSAESAAERAAELVEFLDAEEKTIKIGNGDMGAARDISRQILLRIPECVPHSRSGGRPAAARSHNSVRLYYVDERHTSARTRRCNQGGRRDIVSARFISRMATAQA